MCGRFYIENDIEDVISSYGITDVKKLNASKGEIFPGTNIPVILNKDHRTLDFFRWGYKVHGLSKEIINARIETAMEKSSFKNAFLHNRCIIPANAFFEWKNEEKGKTKYKISLKEVKLFSLAGIYKSFVDKNNISYFGVVILTRAANEQMSKVHNRMPVIIKKEDEDQWLSDSDTDILKFREKLEKENWFNLNIGSASGSEQLSLYNLMSSK
ncbi:MAG: response-associated peptidase [Clostridiaceae bacterium]|jgi:putative SOS response-associated peptidase YedK|nr:response-associated peptidase [Clostridiaceae bacterium]